MKPQNPMETPNLIPSHLIQGRCGLIGHTGFVGSNLLAQFDIDACYNSKNIETLDGETFDWLFCAGAPGVKWRANQEPEADQASLLRLMAHLEGAQAKHLVLISTVDVYDLPLGVNEDTPIAVERLQPYGKHRFQLESFVQSRFPRSFIIRLPGLFGAGLKKNILFDFLTNNNLRAIHTDAIFQFYDLSRFRQDFERALHHAVPLVNFAVPPLRVGAIAAECFGKPFENRPEGAIPPRYDMQTRYGALWGSEGPYIVNDYEAMQAIKHFVDRFPHRSPSA